MEMVATMQVGVGENLTPPLFPIAYSLYDSFITSHCASCFSSLPPDPLRSLDHPLHYCSLSCSSSHSPLHLSSGSHHLIYNEDETSDLRVALILLLQIKRHQFSFKSYDRLCGLMTNHRKLLDDYESSTRIKKGVRAMAAAISMRDGMLDSDYLLEEAVLCVVVTNAVEVQDKTGRSVGIALYGICFSWINHSCSPNACYQFLPPENHGDGQQCLIAPASSNVSEDSTTSNFLTGLAEIYGGTRIVVRSIKAIKKGEQVTVAYTDLLQPKELRQWELWSKYRFTCFCHRCLAVPLTYVDQRLQEICDSNGNGKLLHNAVVESLTEYIDDAIDDYLSSSDAKSCCRKLEDLLLNGFNYEQLIIRLHPQNHLSLNAYTTLASAYKARAIAMEDENAIKMSAAYSLLLAVVTHDLFLSQSSLIASVSNFWISAGEALLNLAQTLASSDIPSCSKCCSKCRLSDIFESDFSPNKVLEISNEFLCCIADITPKLWKYLVNRNGYLKAIKDPIDLRWFETTLKSYADKRLDVEAIWKGQERIELFRLGFHCLLYGGILSNISGGGDSYLSCNVRNLLDL